MIRSSKSKAAAQAKAKAAKAEEDALKKKEKSAVKIQCLIRKFVAKCRIKKQSNAVWLRVFDPSFKIYFWYNRLNKASRWDTPLFSTLITQEDIDAAIKIGSVVRGFIGRMQARKVAWKRYGRFYDVKTNKFYWVDNETGKSTYVVSSWLNKQQIPMPNEDIMLHSSQLKIKELEDKLKEKDREIKDIRRKRYEELEPEVILDKVSQAKTLKRSRNMNEWKTEDLAAWFTELKMEQYIKNLFANRVDGLLFINLNDEDWQDLGITNRVHTRKLQLILKSYRYRYQQFKDKVEVDDDEDLVSEYSPSELSALIAAEEVDEESDSDDDRSYTDSYDSGENERADLTEEQRLQLDLDAQNIKIDLMVRGDAVSFPMVGDIVRVRYVCTLTETGKTVMSTKNVLGRPWVEFVLGIDHVIKGFDRALPQMSVGERSKLTFTPEYAYGETGLPPHIPPNTSISFDLTLLGYRARSVWVKPLIQDEKTNELPYQEDADLRMNTKMNSTGPPRLDDGLTLNSSQMSIISDERSIQSGGLSTVKHSVL